MAKLITYIFIGSILLSCDTLKEGKVISKYIEPAHDYLYMMPIPHTVSTGKTTSTYYTYIPVWMHDDEDYVITLDGFTEKEHKEVQKTFYVSKSRYNSIRLGQIVCIDNACSESPNDDITK